MTRAIIIEDDPRHALSLQELLRHTTKAIDVVHQSTNVPDAYQAILKLQPQLVFLDIDLEGSETGFDLLKKFENPNFAVIFTTQHSNSSNAIAALRACALDFLPKPLSLDELNDALDRLDDGDSVRQTQTLTENMKAVGEKIQAVWIAGTEGKIKLAVSDILYCESDSVYTHFYLAAPANKTMHYITTKSLKDWEKILLNSDIFRVHNEFLVNEKYVLKYHTKLSGSAELALQGGKRIPVSKARKREVRARLKL